MRCKDCKWGIKSSPDEDGHDRWFCHIGLPPWVTPPRMFPDRREVDPHQGCDLEGDR